MLICKGAPEAILAVCDRRRDGSASVHLDNEARDTITAKLKSLAAQGLRAVAVATKTCATPGDALAPSDEADLIFEGFCSVKVKTMHNCIAAASTTTCL